MNDREKINRYDMLDCIDCVEKCPHCRKVIAVKLTNFKTVSFKYGLTWTCPHCYADFHIKNFELEENK